MLTCARCGQSCPPEQQFCTSCGTRLAPPVQEEIRCNSCGHPNQRGTQFCTNCGRPLAVQTKMRVNTPLHQALTHAPDSLATLVIQAPITGQVLAGDRGAWVCSECRGFVRADARQCKHCGVALSPAQTETSQKGGKVLMLLVMALIFGCILIIGALTLLGRMGGPA